MAKKLTNHVVPISSGWTVKKFGAAKASRTFDNKAEAVNYGRNLSKAEETELYIHEKNGMIQEIKSYGNDTFIANDKN